MMTFARALCIGCSTAILLVTGAAQAQEACTSYVVVEGDHLRGIARHAYGDPDLYRLIYDANQDVIGAKADLIQPGASLMIPCKPGTSGAEAVAVAEPEVEALTTEVVDPAAVALSTEVIDPAKEPVVILPEIPVAADDGEAAAEPVVTVAEKPTTTADEPAPQVTETAPAEDQTATATATVAVAPPAEEPPATEVAVAPETTAPAAEEAEGAAPDESASADEPVVVAEEAAVEQPAAQPEAAVEVAAAPAAATAETAMPQDEGPIRIVTGNGYAPFADEMLPGGGLFTQIVEMAIFRADPNLPYSLTFINDWQAHIDALLPSHAYDLSFPWERPNCEAPETLSTGDLSRCSDFVFSAPYYEVVDGFFVAAESDLLISTEYSDFLGKRICRPEAYTTGVLEAQGLTPDTVTLSRPQEASICFDALAKGDVDLVSIDTAVGDSILTKMKLTEKFRQNPNLTTVSTLHVIAHKSNARAVAMLKVLDEGLMEMNQSGEWFDIISDALGKQ